jgi:hypothetical protein
MYGSCRCVAEVKIIIRSCCSEADRYHLESKKVIATLRNGLDTGWSCETVSLNRLVYDRYDAVPMLSKPASSIALTGFQPM